MDQCKGKASGTQEQVPDSATHPEYGPEAAEAMGTRINALFDHNLPDYRDRDECLRRLASATSATAAVRDYWLAADTEGPHSERVEWQSDPILPFSHNLRRYTGPGCLFLTVTQVSARVRTGGRWRGFLSIEPLRRVHLTAFHAIGRALGADTMALYGDSDEVDGLFWDGLPLRACVEWMRGRWGPPKECTTVIDPLIVAATDHGPPLVWFLVNVES